MLSMEGRGVYRQARRQTDRQTHTHTHTHTHTRVHGSVQGHTDDSVNSQVSVCVGGGGGTVNDTCIQNKQMERQTQSVSNWTLTSCLAHRAPSGRMREGGAAWSFLASPYSAQRPGPFSRPLIPHSGQVLSRVPLVRTAARSLLRTAAGSFLASP